ncbi:MAG: single-stranded DNA-binding protein [Anaerolineae bacterium]|nr:single-stranded DNA-binding protein [Anaerolineae bacterium]
MYQKIVIAGNLGGDPQMRYTPSGVPVTSFSVATNRKWTDASGNPQERTVWFRVTAWRKLAETCNQYLNKGSKVLVEGEMEPDPQTGGPRMWQDKDGRTRASYEVTAREVRFLGGAGQGGGAASMGGAASGTEEAGGPLNEDEVPF